MQQARRYNPDMDPLETPRRRVLLCSIDGCRPDGLAAAHTPVIDRLIAEGASTLRARTVMPSSTLPCHTSMLRGVPPERHGITSNTFAPLVRPVPSLMEAASSAGRKVGFFYNWEQLRDLAAPGYLDASMCYGNAVAPETDPWVAEQAVAHFAKFDFDLVFVYFGHTDEVGHIHGWMSEPYLDAIAGADRCLGTVIDGLKAAGRWDETVTCVVSDHGGHGRSHGTDCDEDMTIPWILRGPGVRHGVELSEPVRIFDTCPTLAALLGIPLAREWDGRVVREALIGWE